MIARPVCWRHRPVRLHEFRAARLLLRTAIFILMAMVVPALAEEPYESLPANTAVFLGNHTCEKPASTGTQRSCSTIFDYSGLAFDPVTRRPLVFGGGHSSLFTDTVQYFEPATATWGQYYTPTPCASMDVVGGNFDSSRQAWLSGPSGPYPRPVSRHSYDMNVVVGRELLVIAQSVGMSACPGSNYGSGDPFIGGGRIAHYNLDTSEWTFSPTAPGDGHPEDGGNITYPGADWDPVLQRVVLVGRYGLWTYDPVSRVKVRHLGTWRDADTNATISGATIGYDNALVYAEVTDRHYYIARQAQLVYEVVLNRADLGQSRLRPIITGVPSDRARGATYDSVAQKILWGPSNGQIRVIDPVAKTFTQTSMLVQGTGTPGTGREHALVYDPTRNVTYFVNEQAQTWAYRYATAGTPPPVEPPDAPGAPVLTRHDYVALQWTDESDNEDAVEVWRAEEGGAYALLATLGANATTYLDATITRGRLTCWQVRAVNQAGASAYSTETCLTP